MAYSSASGYYESEIQSEQYYNSLQSFPSTWHPVFGNQIDIEPKVNVTAFGDGYEVRTVDGINNQKQVWSLTFEGTAERITEIAKFLKAKGAHKSFKWITPDHSIMDEGTAGNLEDGHGEVTGDDFIFRYDRNQSGYRYFVVSNIIGNPEFQMPNTDFDIINDQLPDAQKFNNTTKLYTGTITDITVVTRGITVIGYDVTFSLNKVNISGTNVQNISPALTMTAKNLPTITSPTKQEDAHNIETHEIRVVCRKWSRTRNQGWQQLTCTFEQVFEY